MALTESQNPDPPDRLALANLIPQVRAWLKDSSDDSVTQRMASAEKLYAADMLKQLNSGGFKTTQGTLYPLLARLRRAGLIEHEWKESSAGPPRKYYTLTRAGGQRLDDLRLFWTSVNKALVD